MPSPDARRRSRKSLLADREAIALRVAEFFHTDLRNRTYDTEARLQRYAKYRMWTEPKTFPWDDACFSLDTDVLTSEGWRPIASVKEGDRVLTRCAEGICSYETVTNTTRTTANDGIRIHGKSIDLLVTRNHRMLVAHLTGKQKFVRAEEFLEKGGLTGWRIPLTSKWRGEIRRTIYGIDARAYVRLLGWYLAEGSALNCAKSGSLSIAQCMVTSKERCEMIAADCAAAGVSFKQHPRTFTLHARSMPPEMAAEFRSLGLCHEKRIPKHVFSLGPELLRELLDALVEGDGWTSKKNGHKGYYTTSPGLADDVQTIAQLVGLRGTIIKREAKLGGTIRGRQITGTLDGYTIHLNRKKFVKIYLLSSVVEHFDEPREFACVDVPPHHTLYVRRNGKAVWCGNSNIPLTDLMEKSLKMEDTLHNAVLSQRPPVGAQAVVPADHEKEGGVDDLIDFQFFVENQGERIVGSMANAFLNDGVVYVFIPWVREERELITMRVFPPIPDQDLPGEYFLALLRQSFPDSAASARANGWEWDLLTPREPKDDKFSVSFFTSDTSGEVEMLIRRSALVFDGPRPTVKDYEDVLYPTRAANLQPPGPSNPHGASHVILRDYPTVDEVKRLVKSGFYDLLSGEEMKALDNYSKSGADEEEKKQKDDLEGKSDEPRSGADKKRAHTTLTRLTCFDCYDLDGDGIAEDVIWWVLLEPKILLRARHLSEMYPANRRPIVSSAFLEVRGRVAGISLLELLEGTHDAMKAIFDQTIDSGTLNLAPFGFYRAAGGLRAEPIQVAPGFMYPLADPQRDLNFPQIGNPNAMVNGLNAVSILGQMQERVSAIGDLQLGRVPPGKSTALRNFRSMALLTGEAESRPERILRRFFTGLAEIWKQIHDLNQAHLPMTKQIRVSGFPKAGADPYRQIERDEVSGDFRFDFKANVLNTSKQALQQSLEALLGIYVNPMTVQLGIMKPDGMYRLLSDVGKALGQDPDQYLSEPTPRAGAKRILAEEALNEIISGQIPEGEPLEGPQAHLQRIIELVEQAKTDPRWQGVITADVAQMVIAYTNTLRQRIAGEIEQQQLVMAASQFGQGAPGQGVPGPPATNIGTAEPAAQGVGELVDESLPSAGGGANTGVVS